MLDLERAQQAQNNYYSTLSTEADSHTVNAITHFAFSDAARVPELFRNFAMEYFNLERYSRVDLDRLNSVLNELWDGPGSAGKISDIIWEIRKNRRANVENPGQALKGYVVPTVDSDLQAVED